MKKILLLTGILLGVATASQAGVRFSFGFPVPVPPPVVVAPPAPVYVQPPQVYYPEPQVYAPAPVVVAPPIIEFGFRDYRRPYYRDYPYRYRAPYGHRDWDHDHDGYRGYRK
jgi:hypothetical protein